MSKIQDDYRDELIKRFNAALIGFETQLKSKKDGFEYALVEVEKYSKNEQPVVDPEKFAEKLRIKIANEYTKAITVAVQKLLNEELAVILAEMKYPT
jgi:hypothetical protein